MARHSPIGCLASNPVGVRLVICQPLFFLHKWMPFSRVSINQSNQEH